MALNAGFEYREQIGDIGRGSTALAYLSRRYRHSSEAEWLARIHADQVFLDGMRAHPDSCSTRPVAHMATPPWNEPDVPLSFAVLHEDRDLLAVAKPNGLPTAPAGAFSNIPS
jgi:23S rRNA pseudouridine1911/1915/1917 synthase